VQRCWLLEMVLVVVERQRPRMDGVTTGERHPH